MALQGRVRLDHAGIGAILKSGPVRALVSSAAQSVAGAAKHTTEKGEELPVQVDSYTTDRAAASVTIAHPAGAAAQAKHGVLTRAAGSAGLEVTAGGG